MSDEPLAESFKHCEALAREHARDFWLAALFAPAGKRKYLHALIAFAFETGRVKAIAREPLAGEMRLTWWIEAIEGLRDGEARNHPVAAALLATIVAAELPTSAFEAWLISRRNELYQDAPASVADSGRALQGPLYALSARVLGVEADEAAGHAGAAEALAAAGQFGDALAQIDAAEARLAPGAAPAFAELGALKLDARRGLKGKPPASLWRRQIAIWRWASTH